MSEFSKKKYSNSIFYNETKSEIGTENETLAGNLMFGGKLIN